MTKDLKKKAKELLLSLTYDEMEDEELNLVLSTRLSK